jgi:hypothetical protein
MFTENFNLPLRKLCGPLEAGEYKPGCTINFSEFLNTTSSNTTHNTHKKHHTRTHHVKHIHHHAHNTHKETHHKHTTHTIQHSKLSCQSTPSNLCSLSAALFNFMSCVQYGKLLFIQDAPCVIVEERYARTAPELIPVI